MRTIGVVTVARSDYGIYLPILRQIREAQDLELHLIVSGMHLSPEFGSTHRVIEQDGFSIRDRVEMLLSSDSPEGVGKSIGLGVIGFAQLFANIKLDVLLVLGDRFEMFAAVMAALAYTIPVAHLHGGEATEGLIDESIRHSITKMSHLHFVSTETYRQRVIQMGEEPWRVTHCGAPSLDNLNSISLLDKAYLETLIGMELDLSPLLVTFHPVTLEYQDTEDHIGKLLEALDRSGLPVVFTYPNADTSGRIIIRGIEEYVASHTRARALENLGTQAYFSLMGVASAMVGNSSSGIIEAASFKLPVVDIGDRQRGRVRGVNVIHADYDSRSVFEAIQVATSKTFHESLADLRNPYGNGQASKQIVDVLRKTPLDRRLLLKRFYDLEVMMREL